MHCVLCMLCLFVDTVDTKIKACNVLNAMFVNTGVCGFTQHYIQSNEVWKLYSTMYLKLLKLCMVCMLTQSM